MAQQSSGSTMIDDLYKLIEVYLRTVRSQITTLDPKVEQVFVSSIGIPLTLSQVSTSVYRTCQREGIATIGRIYTTIVRKSLVTEMHARMPDVVSKLRRISAEQRKDIPLSSEKMTSTEKVSGFLSSTRFAGDVSGSVNTPTS